MDADFILALQLQEQFDIEHESASLWPSDDSTQSNVSSNNNNKPTTMTPWGGGGGGGPSSRVPHHTDPERPLSIVDESWETLDPSPDVRAMFLTFNDRFFWGKLSGVEVKWSPRMTLCAGVCSYEGRGGLCSIRLSAPLLKLRPRRDLVETLLHEMIHALLFVTQNNRDRDGHGPEFCKHMNRINTETGTKISIYHSFNDEVDVYRTHWWRCDGPCQNRKPFLGYVKRAMNRAPSATDPWWADHRRSCGGTFVKVKEPEGYKKKGKAAAVAASGKDEKNTPETQAPGNAKSSKPTTGSSGSQDIRSFIPFSGKGLLLGGNSGPSTSNASSSGGDHLPKRPLQSPAFSPKKPLFSPSSQTNASPSSLQGRLGSPVKGGLAGTSPWNRTGPSSKVPKKRSVGNTRYFTNVNGSPVKLAKPLPRASIPSGGIRGRGDPRTTTKGSIADIFNRRTLKTSSPSATVSKPPDEATGAAPSSSSNRNSSSAGSESSLSTATATTPKPSFITVKKEGSNHPSVFPTASKPSSATQTKHSFIAVKKEGSNHPSVFPTVSKPSSATVKKESSSHPSVFPTVSKPSSATVKKESSSHPSVFPTPSKPSSATQSKPSFITVKKEDSHHPSLFPTASKLNPAKPNRSDHSEHADRGGGAGAGPSSRKRPLDDSADLVSFLREALSPTSPEVKRPRVSSPSSSSARASSAVVAETPISSSRQASSTSTNSSSSSSSSNPSVPSSTSGPITGAASSSAVSCPVCQAKVHESKINEHLDSCLSWQHLN